MTDYKALIGRVRDGYTCTDPLHRDLADAVEALVAENGRLDSENAKGGTIVQRAADIALRTPFSLQQATESLTWTTDVWQRFKKAETDRDAALKALGESRARFGDMEQRAAAARARFIEELRFLAAARAEYCHLNHDDVGAFHRASPHEQWLHSEHATAEGLADIIDGANDGRGWLPSWRWDDWTELRDRAEETPE